MLQPLTGSLLRSPGGSACCTAHACSTCSRRSGGRASRTERSSCENRQTLRDHMSTLDTGGSKVSYRCPASKATPRQTSFWNWLGFWPLTPGWSDVDSGDDQCRPLAGSQGQLCPPPHRTSSSGAVLDLALEAARAQGTYPFLGWVQSQRFTFQTGDCLPHIYLSESSNPEKRDSRSLTPLQPTHRTPCPSVTSSQQHDCRHWAGQAGLLGATPRGTHQKPVPSPGPVTPTPFPCLTAPIAQGHREKWIFPTELPNCKHTNSIPRLQPTSAD